MISAVLWDMDGVLLDSERLCLDAFKAVMANAFPEQDADAIFRETIGLNPTAIKALYQDRFCNEQQAEAIYDQVSERMVALMTTELRLKPGVVAALEAVERSGLPQMVVTSTRADRAEKKLAQFELLPYFAGLIGGDQVTLGKPHPEPYQKGCAHLATRADKTLVIEDSANGVRSGLAAGCQVMHVPDLLPTSLEWRDDLTAILSSLEDFPAWLAQNQKAEL